MFCFRRCLFLLSEVGFGLRSGSFFFFPWYSPALVGGVGGGLVLVRDLRSVRDRLLFRLCSAWGCCRCCCFCHTTRTLDPALDFLGEARRL